MEKLQEIINKFIPNHEQQDWHKTMMKEYVVLCLEKAAEEAVVFLPTHYGLHGTHNVDKQSITNIELP